MTTQGLRSAESGRPRRDRNSKTIQRISRMIADSDIGGVHRRGRKERGRRSGESADRVIRRAEPSRRESAQMNAGQVAANEREEHE
jgi:hypothetical protein